MPNTQYLLSMILLTTSLSGFALSLDIKDTKEQNKQIIEKVDNLTKKFELQNEVIKNIITKYEK